MSSYRARRGSPLVLGGALLAALAVGGIIGALAIHPGGKGSPTGTGGQHRGRQSPPALTVSSVTPASGVTNVAPTSAITIRFSSSLAKHVVMPTLSPEARGVWHASGKVLSFQPSVAFLPLSVVTITVPDGPGGVRAINGGQLAQDFVGRFTIQNGSILRLQQLLSLLDYSPLAWTAAAPAIATGDAAQQAAALYDPPLGSFAWRNRGWPHRIRALWHQGSDTLFTTGLVMSFQADHELTPDGTINSALWSNLLTALADHAVNTGGYNYAFATKVMPETLTIWHDGKIVLQSQANTGIPQSPTPVGTFPVYARLRSQVMRGTNPSGTKYADLVQYVAYFDGNDAVHYMDRADYGIPQSLGCIELPLASAAAAWPYLAYGTLVTIVD